MRCIEGRRLYSPTLVFCHHRHCTIISTSAATMVRPCAMSVISKTCACSLFLQDIADVSHQRRHTTVRKKLLMLLVPYLKSWHHVRQPEQVDNTHAVVCIQSNTTQNTPFRTTLETNFVCYPTSQPTTDIWWAQVPTTSPRRQCPRSLHPSDGHVDLLLPSGCSCGGSECISTRRHV